MQTAKRQHAAVMIERLLAAPYRYRFAQPLDSGDQRADRRQLGLNAFLTVSARKARRSDIRSVLCLTTATRPAGHIKTEQDWLFNELRCAAANAEFNSCSPSRSSETRWLP
jgi:hypothetical protein